MDRDCVVYLGKNIKPLTSRLVYNAPVSTDAERQGRYSGLFDSDIPANAIEAIRESANKSRVRGDDQFKQEIE